MRALLIGHDEAVIRFVARRVGCTWFHRAQAVGQLQDGKLIAGVVWDTWNGASMQIHAAAEPGSNWLNPELIREAFRYPFEMCGAKKLIALAAEANTKSCTLLSGLGFVREATLADAHPTGALIVHTMTPAQCRWLERGKHGKRLTAAS